MAKTLEEHFGYLSDRIKVERYRKALQAAVQPGQVVLDLGCGNGELLERLIRDKGVRGQGVELDPEAVIACAERGITRASWSVVVRRLAEVMAMALPFLLLLLLPVLLNLDHVYEWASEHRHHLTDELAAHKAPFLNTTFFWIRWVAYFAIWTFMAAFFWRNSRKQDATKDKALTVRMENFSGPAILLFAVGGEFLILNRIRRPEQPAGEAPAEAEATAA